MKEKNNCFSKNKTFALIFIFAIVVLNVFLGGFTTFITKVKEQVNERDLQEVVSSLEFVHITKTGGSSIERAAASAGIRWGACHYGEEFLKRDFGNTCSQNLKWGKMKQSEVPNEVKGAYFNKWSSAPWHTPPHWWETNPLQKTKTFTVVRNPYTRALSEFYCKWAGSKEWSLKNDVQHLNSWLQNKIRKPPHDGHFLPQYFYVFNTQGEKVVNHVLQFEKLNTEFPILMEQYSFDVSLAKYNVGKDKHLTYHNLTRETLDLLNIFYAEDFEFFDYEIL